jgi:hypothetical protein
MHERLPRAATVPPGQHPTDGEPSPGQVFIQHTWTRYGAVLGAIVAAFLSGGYLTPSDNAQAIGALKSDVELRFQKLEGRFDTMFDKINEISKFNARIHEMESKIQLLEHKLNNLTDWRKEMDVRWASAMHDWTNRFQRFKRKQRSNDDDE